MDPFASALEIAAAIRAKKVSPVDVAKGYLDRIDRYNVDLNAVTWRRDDELLAEAKQAEEAVLAGGKLAPFHGVPIPIKDLVDVVGWPITYGSKSALGRVASRTAAVVRALQEAGFLLLCRTNTPEFGAVSVTENVAYGATRNPWDRNRTPGGSSGGSAACVSAGMAPVAHGNDGGGSLRIPASCCGLVGLKPSRGRVSMGPLVSDVMHGGAVEGCLTRTLADTAAILDVISTPDLGAWYNAPSPERPFAKEVGVPAGRLRIAFTTIPPTGVPVDDACQAAVDHTAKLLAELGHDVFEGTPEWPAGAEMIQGFLTVWNTSPAYWEVEDWDKVEPHNAAMREQAMATDSITYVRSLLGLQAQSRQIVRSWGTDFDLLLTPTIAIEPPEIGALWKGAEDDPLAPITNAATMVPFTPWFNVTGQPAVSLPTYWSESGLPIGVQLVGRPWGEAELIRVASQLEKVSGWTERRPPLG